MAGSTGLASCSCINDACQVSSCSIAAIWSPCEKTVNGVKQSDRSCCATGTTGSCSGTHVYQMGTSCARARAPARAHACMHVWN